MHSFSIYLLFTFKYESFSLTQRKKHVQKLMYKVRKTRYNLKAKRFLELFDCCFMKICKKILL